MEARVVAVRDGDTLEIRRSGRTYSLDVAEIDCPELEQPFGREARQAATDMAAGATIRIGLQGMPGGGRLVGSVRLPDGRDLAGELLRRGLAWWTGGSGGGGSATLKALERQARAAGRGLWSRPEPVPPWIWRGEARSKPMPLERAVPPAVPDESPGSSRRPAPSRGCIPRSRCCRVCSKGKACGNSCISARYTCHQGRGCACNSYEICA